jgi:hypothetical protein
MFIGFRTVFPYIAQERLRSLLKRDSLDADEVNVLRAIHRWASRRPSFKRLFQKKRGMPRTARLLSRGAANELRRFAEDCVKLDFISVSDLCQVVQPMGIFSVHRLFELVNSRILRDKEG